MTFKSEIREHEDKAKAMRAALSQVPAPCDCSASDIAQAQQEVEAHGLPPTPARFQRKFRWGYRQASTAFEAVGGMLS